MLSITEFENEISSEEYNLLNKNISRHTIEKIRLKIPINEFIAEIDIYYKELKGLITIEVEFNTEEQANSFVPPAWFGKKLDKKVFSNSELSKCDKKDLENILSKEEYLRNESIGNKIKKIIEQNI